MRAERERRHPRSARGEQGAAPGDESVIWHEIECGAYAADLPLWEELAEECGGPILDLGCGSGRVALHLARRGHTVLGLDLDEALVAALNARAASLPASAVAADARSFELGRRFALVLAPMQLVQLLGGRAERISCLSRAASHLRPGGKVALALAENALGAAAEAAADTEPPAPDAREIGGWVYSSLPLPTVADGGRFIVRRLRQTVSPAGELSEEIGEVSLHALSASTLEDEAVAAGLRPAGRRRIEQTADHIGSTVVVLQEEA